MKRILLLLLPLVPALPALAQTSASYTLNEHALNAGGHPEEGITMISASFRVSLDAIGDAVRGRVLSSASYHVDGGFVGAYPPPGEVRHLRLTDHETLVWDAERSVGVYHLYRDLLSSLSGLGYGSCAQSDLPTTTAIDSDVPAVDDGYFYLVTAENRLDEEGTKGWDSSDAERPNPAPCP